MGNKSAAVETSSEFNVFSEIPLHPMLCEVLKPALYADYYAETEVFSKFKLPRGIAQRDAP